MVIDVWSRTFVCLLLSGCPLNAVYGFVDNRLSLPESFSSYVAEVGYLKRPNSVAALLRGNVAVDSAGSTAGKMLLIGIVRVGCNYVFAYSSCLGLSDYSLGSSRVVASPSQNGRVSFTLRDDRIAAEDEETLELLLTVSSIPALPEDAFLLNRLSIAILDSDGELFEISIALPGCPAVPM